MRYPRACTLCGQSLGFVKLVGRPREFHPNCKKVVGLVSWLENVLPTINFDSEKYKKFRGELWRLGNNLNIQK